MTWLFEEKSFDDPKEYYGFVYEITNNDNGRKYIGRKYFTRAKTLPPLKGKTRKRRSRIDSDWREYWGSSEKLKEEINTYGEGSFTRRILRLCKTKGETNYWEAKLQFEADVLNAKLPSGDFAYYNENIMMKFTRRNIGI